MLDTPAGVVRAEYVQSGEYVENVRIANVPSFHYAENLKVDCPDLGELAVDVAYGGNFYAIVEPQENFRDMADHSASQLVTWSPVIRKRLNEQYQFEHPENPEMRGITIGQLSGAPHDPGNDRRNAVIVSSGNENANSTANHPGDKARMRCANPASSADRGVCACNKS